MNYILEDEPRANIVSFFAEQQFSGSLIAVQQNAGFLAIKTQWPNDYKNMTIVF
jgi:hypothetical protein